MKFRILLSFAAASAASAITCQAALIFEDEFSGYSSGDLHNQAGSADVGSYAVNWAASGGSNFGSPSVAAGSLSYSEGSNALVAGGDKVSALRTELTGNYYKAAVGQPRATPTTSGSVLYISGLMRLGDSDDAYFGLQIGSDNVLKDLFGFGLNSSGNALIISEDGDSNHGSYGQAPTTRGTSTDIFSTSTNNFFVAKVTNEGGAGSNDLVELFVNPTLNAEPGSATVSAEWGNTVWFPSNNLQYLVFNANVNGGAAQTGTQWDEIRVGNTYADVTPFTVIPEPSSAAILGLLGIFGFGLRRRR